MVSQRLKSGKTQRLYNDYRKMLSENELDTVLIGTPDHWHALQAIEEVQSCGTGGDPAKKYKLKMLFLFNFFVLSCPPFFQKIKILFFIFDHSPCIIT
ncbi:MAG TPA: hypothetical protein VKA92_10045, partial [Segetibacter sp.]|nr:hypothetical protein [Segetibacter sp.]